MSLRTIEADILAISKNPRPLSPIPKSYKRRLSRDSFLVFSICFSKKHGKSQDWQEQFFKTLEFAFFLNCLTNTVVEGDMIKEIPPSRLFSVSECLECSSPESWSNLCKRLARDAHLKEAKPRKSEWKLLQDFKRKKT